MKINSKNALGKGLSALLASNDSDFSDKESRSLSITDIVFNPEQPRKKFAEDALQELAASIKQHGILQPVLVAKKKDVFVVIAGERRVRAATIAGLQEIPVIVLDVDERTALELALLENIQREDLSPMEEAASYNSLIEKYNYTHEELAEKLGKSRSHISNMLRLYKMPTELTDLVDAKKLSVGHAKAIVASSDPIIVARMVVDKKMSVREAEQYVAKEKKRHAKQVQNMHHAGDMMHKDTGLLEVELMLEQKLGLKVQINDTQEGGELIIHFTHLQQLDWLINKLGSDYKL